MNTIDTFCYEQVDPSWKPILKTALAKIDPCYLKTLLETDWLPGKNNIFNAFSQPLDQVRYVLFGESPYPRQASANGYAFYDAAVSNLWTETGLSKAVNRATSLRNFIKMLLLAEGLLSSDTLSQEAIAAINKTRLIQTNDQLFGKLLDHGFLLLNASLVLQVQSPEKDAKAWQPFITHIIETLITQSQEIKWLLFGRIAHTILPFLEQTNRDHIIVSEHPYNLSFIKRPSILRIFQPLHLLHI